MDGHTLYVVRTNVPCTRPVIRSQWVLLYLQHVMAIIVLYTYSSSIRVEYVVVVKQQLPSIHTARVKLTLSLQYVVQGQVGHGYTQKQILVSTVDRLREEEEEEETHAAGQDLVMGWPVVARQVRQKQVVLLLSLETSQANRNSSGYADRKGGLTDCLPTRTSKEEEEKVKIPLKKPPVFACTSH